LGNRGQILGLDKWLCIAHVGDAEILKIEDSLQLAAGSFNKTGAKILVWRVTCPAMLRKESFLYPVELTYRLSMENGF
jgi:hypothetical protein